MKPDKMLREIVQRGVSESTLEELTGFGVVQFDIDTENSCVYLSSSRKDCGGRKRYSIADLIDSTIFMKVVYGEDMLCEIRENGEKDVWCDPKRDCTNCGEAVGLPNYKDVQREAIALEGDEQIKYMYGRMER
jgi:hypothetical protein